MIVTFACTHFLFLYPNYTQSFSLVSDNSRRNSMDRSLLYLQSFSYLLSSYIKCKTSRTRRETQVPISIITQIQFFKWVNCRSHNATRTSSRHIGSSDGNVLERVEHVRVCVTDKPFYADCRSRTLFMIYCFSRRIYAFITQ